MISPISLRLPGETSSTRLVIRVIMKRDFQQYQQIFVDPQTTQFTGGVLTAKEIYCNFNNCLKALESLPIRYKTFAVTTKASDSMIGIATLVWQEGKNNCVELGVMFNPYNQRKGFCVELVNRLLEHCFSDSLMDTVFSFILIENTPAQRVLKKVGFIESLKESLANYSANGSYWIMSKEQFKQEY